MSYIDRSLLEHRHETILSVCLLMNVYTDSKFKQIFLRNICSSSPEWKLQWLKHSQARPWLDKIKTSGFNVRQLTQFSLFFWLYPVSSDRKLPLALLISTQPCPSLVAANWKTLFPSHTRNDDFLLSWRKSFLQYGSHSSLTLIRYQSAVARSYRT